MVAGERPTVADFQEVLGHHGIELRRNGAEWAGPCPLCGGVDRFHVADSGGYARIGCRGCIDGQGEAGKRAYGEIVALLWPDRNKKSSSRPFSPSRQRAATSDPQGDTATTPSQATALWRASIEATGNATGSLTHIYLAGRRTWPPPELGFDLPATVGWIDRDAWPVELHHYPLPDQAAGAVVFAITDASGNVQAVQIEALTAQGKRLRQRWRLASAAVAAGLGEGFNGHSCRVGMAQDLAAAGVELPALMTAGRWSSEKMPARYTRNQTAARGAIARYYGE